MKYSIGNRLLFTLLGLIATVWLVSVWSSFRSTQHEVGEIFDAQLAQSTRSMLILSRHELQELADLPPASDHIHFIPDNEPPAHGHRYELKIAYQIWLHPQGTLLLRSDNAPGTQLSDAGEGFSDRTINGEQWRIFTLVDPLTGYQVQMGESYMLRNQLINQIALRLAIPTLLALPLLALLISFGIRHALAPLRTLARAVAHRAPDSLEPVADQNIPDEIKPLVEALNTLFLRLENAFENERRFTADAAHELRTPLAALKVQAQVAQRATDSRQRQDAIGNLLRGVDRASRLVEQLLTLARLDPLSGLVSHESIALTRLTAEVLSDLENTARERRIELSLDGEENATIQGQSDSVRMLVTNLVDNGLRYTPEGGTVRVIVTSSGNNGITLQVEDSGPGIADEDREHIFDRFYRGHDVTASGSGLGLSIVKRIAGLHKATIGLDRSTLGGLRVTVTFPANP